MAASKPNRTRALLDMLGIAGVGLAILIGFFGLFFGLAFVLVGLGTLGFTAILIVLFSKWRRRREAKTTGRGM